MSEISITDRDIVTNAVIFSDLSYADQERPVLPPGNWEAVEFVNADTKISSVDGLDNPNTGYQARAWFNKDSRQIYFANAGTNDAKDAAGWLSAQRGVRSSQFTDALNAGLKVRALIEDEKSDYRLRLHFESEIDSINNN